MSPEDPSLIADFRPDTRRDDAIDTQRDRTPYAQVIRNVTGQAVRADRGRLGAFRPG
jgi:hypothetical protein